MSLFFVEFGDGTDGVSRVCQPVVTDTAERAADIAFDIAGHIAGTGVARVIVMTVSEVATCRSATAVIEIPVTFDTFLDHVAAWIDHYSAGDIGIDDLPDYPYHVAYAGTRHASVVARDAIATVAR